MHAVEFRAPEWTALTQTDLLERERTCWTEGYRVAKASWFENSGCSPEEFTKYLGALLGGATVERATEAAFLNDWQPENGQVG